MSATDSANGQIHLLYTNHHSWLYCWLQRKLGNASDAADLAQDTFVRLIGRRAALRAGDESRALLTHIAKGLVIDHWRRQDVERAWRETLAHLPEPEVPSPETAALVLESLYLIEAMLRNLPVRTRRIFLLAQLDGLTYPQIAKQTGCSLITVKRHMRNAFLACLTLE